MKTKYVLYSAAREASTFDEEGNEILGAYKFIPQELQRRFPKPALYIEGTLALYGYRPPELPENIIDFEADGLNESEDPEATGLTPAEFDAQSDALLAGEPVGKAVYLSGPQTMRLYARFKPVVEGV